MQERRMARMSNMSRRPAFALGVLLVMLVCYATTALSAATRPHPTTLRNIRNLAAPSPAPAPTLSPAPAVPSPRSPPPPTPSTPPAQAPATSAPATVPPPPPPKPNKDQQAWCVAKPSADPAALQQALDYACGVDPAFCHAIQPGQPCFQPNTLPAHASFAFNSYWHAMQSHGGTCDFAGNAIISIRDPSYPGCTYVSSSPQPPATPSTPPPPLPEPHQSKTWCVAKPGADPAALQQALDYACGVDPAFCQAIQPGQACFQPNTLPAHASFAFNSYWRALGSHGGTCDFAGNALISDQDPSYPGCTYA